MNVILAVGGCVKSVLCVWFDGKTNYLTWELDILRHFLFMTVPNHFVYSRSLWSCGLRCRAADARLMKSRFRIPQRAWMFVSCVSCVLCRQRLCVSCVLCRQRPCVSCVLCRQRTCVSCVLCRQRPCVSCVLCRQPPLQRVDHWFSGALPRVCVCVCVCVCVSLCVIWKPQQ